MIGPNVVVTLVSNLVDNNKGGKVKSIITTFKNKEVKWKNIYREPRQNARWSPFRLYQIIIKISSNSL